MTAIAHYVLVTLALAFVATPASADDEVAAFYRGKMLQITNAFAEGGLYSTLTRLFAMHLPRHIPGRPNAIPIFMPGAGGLRQMNHLYNAAPKDGTVLGLMYDNIPITQVLQPDDNLKFDARRFAALGSLGRGEAGLVGILKRTGIASVEDARQKESVFGSTGTSSAQYYIPIIMNRLFGTRFKLIPGFPTTTTMYLAMERGELDGIYGAAEVIEESRPQWIAERQLNWLAQLNDVRAPDYPDVPLLQELAQAPARQGGVQAARARPRAGQDADRCRRTCRRRAWRRCARLSWPCCVTRPSSPTSAKPRRSSSRARGRTPSASFARLSKPRPRWSRMSASFSM